MGRNLDDVLISSGLIPAIAANTVIEVDPGLRVNSVAVPAHFVALTDGAQCLGQTLDGWMVIWNPDQNVPIEGVGWIAKHIHSIEGDEDELTVHAQRESGVIPPTWYPNLQ